MDPVVYVYVVLVVVGLAWVTWDRIVRPFAEDMGWIVYEEDRSVSNITPPPPADYVTRMGATSADSATDPGLSDGLSALSEVEALTLEDVMAYRSRENLIRFLVAFGWKTGEIRGLIKGDTGKIGEEVRAARLALGLEDEETPRTPLAGRPIPAGVVFAEE